MEPALCEGTAYGYNRPNSGSRHLSGGKIEPSQLQMYYTVAVMDFAILMTILFGPVALLGTLPPLSLILLKKSAEFEWFFLMIPLVDHTFKRSY